MSALVLARQACAPSHSFAVAILPQRTVDGPAATSGHATLQRVEPKNPIRLVAAWRCCYRSSPARRRERTSTVSNTGLGGPVERWHLLRHRRGDGQADAARSACFA